MRWSRVPRTGRTDCRRNTGQPSYYPAWGDDRPSHVARAVVLSKAVRSSAPLEMARPVGRVGHEQSMSLM